MYGFRQHTAYMEVCLTMQGEKVSLRTCLDMPYFPPTMSFEEELAKAFGLDAPKVTKLRLACEEFLYISPK
jgi:hypothetical protein